MRDSLCQAATPDPVCTKRGTDIYALRRETPVLGGMHRRVKYRLLNGSKLDKTGE